MMSVVKYNMDNLVLFSIVRFSTSNISSAEEDLAIHNMPH